MPLHPILVRMLQCLCHTWCRNMDTSPKINGNRDKPHFQKLRRDGHASDAGQHTHADVDNEDLEDHLSGQSLTFLETYNHVCGTLPMFSRFGSIWAQNIPYICCLWTVIVEQFLIGTVLLNQWAVGPNTSLTCATSTGRLSLFWPAAEPKQAQGLMSVRFSLSL